MRVHIEIFFRPGVLDPQGVAITQSLTGAGFSQLSALRVGKVIECEIAADTPADAEALAKKMCEQLLANPVMETYRITVAQS